MAQYIDKSALVAEITHKIKILEVFIKNFDGISDKVEKAKNKIEALGDALLLLESLEVKEVDLEKEFNSFLDNTEGMPVLWHSDEQIEWAKDIARHFYELGLKARKEEVE